MARASLVIGAKTAFAFIYYLYQIFSKGAQQSLLPKLLLARGLNLLKFCLWVQRPHLLPRLVLAIGFSLIKFCLWV